MELVEHTDSEADGSKAQTWVYDLVYIVPSNSQEKEDIHTVAEDLVTSG